MNTKLFFDPFQSMKYSFHLELKNIMKKCLNLFWLCFITFSISNAQEISPIKLNELLKKAQETNSEAVIVYHNGHLIAENYFGLGNPDKRIESMSSTKSIVALAVACMLTDHLIDSLDIPVANYFPEWRQGQKELITIRHLMTMTSGLQNNPNAGVEIYPSPDFVQLALAAELSNKPGEVWSYNNKALNLMAGVIEKVTGKRMDIYIGERLFKPLGINDFTWSLDEVGNPHVMAGCQIKPGDFAKIGVLLLNEGKFDNEIIISEKYFSEIITPTVQYEGYGMLWWLDYEKTIYTVDDEIILKLQLAGIDEEFIKEVKKMKGIYYSVEDYSEKLNEVFGPNPGKYISEKLGPNLSLRRREFSGKVSYRADGYLGNYIIVDPNTKIVAVRMITHQSFKEEKDNFAEFRKMVLSLTD